MMRFLTHRHAHLVRIAAMVLAVTAVAGCSRYRHGGVDLSDHVPQHYLRGVAAALDLAGENGAEILAAIVEAPEADREALSFLVSDLPAVDLATVGKEFLLETVRLAREARGKYPWGSTVPDDVYLSYVVPPRVSQEPLENWRPYFLEQLEGRLSGVASMEEAALEVNRWCGEHVGFKPTQRRDQGVFETLASGYGRCEEMMIVHIAALRSVCIPARQTWTPFWATSDNNHAWTELWVDGGWHYTGACEPRDALDDAWFNDSVRGAALVLSSVFGPPASGDDVYRQEERFSLVNSIGHYLDPGTLRVSVTERGRPAAGVPVTVSVWNFGALRAIARVDTDRRGDMAVSLGDGTYFVCAGGPRESGWALAEIRAGSETSLSLALRLDEPFDGQFWLRYDGTED
jgi:hypothetical protein